MGSQKDAHIDHLDSFDAGYIKAMTEAVVLVEESGGCLKLASLLRNKLKEKLLKDDPRQLKLL